MEGEIMNAEPPPLRDRRGNELRWYAKVTRARMLTALTELVEEGVPWRDISVRVIAERAGRKAPTFHSYFKNVDQAFLVMMNEAALEDRKLSRRFYVIRRFLMEEQQGYECDHMYDYVWDAEAQVSRGTCLKCGEETVMTHVE